MPTKYHRDTVLSRLAVDSPRKSLFSLFHQAPTGRRMIFVYLFMVSFSFAILLAQRSGNPAFAGFARPFHASAIILEKAPALDGEQARLFLVFKTRSGREVRTWVTPESEAWERLLPGDRLGLVYRQSWSGRRVEVLETGLFALPDNEPVDSPAPGIPQPSVPNMN